MEAILNRLRGTGVIFSIFNYRITGANIYALYYCIVFGFITEWYIGLLMFASFRISESTGWGKWVGQVCYPTSLPQYNNAQGKKFPYIHQLANFISNEKDDYYEYCIIALFIRGMYWSIILYLPLVLFGYISTIDYSIASIIYGIGFPLSCYLSTKVYLNYKSKYISIVEEWETMEAYYGVFHFIVNIFIVWSILR